MEQRQGWHHFARPVVAGIALVLMGLTLSIAGASAQAPDTRPTLTIAVQGLTTTGELEPARETSNVATRIFGSLFDNLIDSDRQGDLSLRAGIARFQRIDDRTIEFKLREGVRFHNGDEVTAEDVAFSFGPLRLWGTSRADLLTGLDEGAKARTAQVPKDAVAVSQRFYPALERLDIIDRYTLRWVNKTPDLTLEGRLAREGAAILSRRAYLEAGNWATWARMPIGTGPYKLKTFNNDVAAVLEAHDAYWGGRPPFREIKFVVVPDVGARVAGLLSGQYDFVSDIPPDQFKTIRADSRFEVVGGPILNHRLIVFDATNPVLKDARIRQAMVHAVDTKAIAETIWLGETSPAPGLQWEFYGPMFIKDWVPPAFDPARARRLLAEAGYKGETIPFRVLNNYYTLQVSTAQILQQMWKDVGLAVEIEMRENFAQIYDTGKPRGVRDWSNTARFSDPVGSMNSQHCQTGGQQLNKEWADEEFNRLCTLLETSSDMTARRAAFRRMLEIIEVENPGYILLHRSTLHYGKRRSIGWKPSPTQAMDFRATNVTIGPIP